MKSNQKTSSFMVSFIVHGAMLLGLFLLKTAVQAQTSTVAIESIFTDEDRAAEEVHAALDNQQVAATSMNTIAGGMVSTEIIPNAFGGQGGSGAGLGDGGSGGSGGTGRGGGAGALVSAVGTEFKVRVGIGDGGMPGLGIIGNELGAGEIGGEIGAVVPGYGAALDRMTQELIRMMRSEKVLVVWMFDESESMKDDQQDLKTRFARVYEELKLVDKDPSALGEGKKKSKEKLSDVLLTVITSFGENFHTHTPKPTSDPAQIVPAIDKIPIDKSGIENTCAALDKVFKQYGGVRAGRKLVIILVSDESGDDWDRLEDVRHQALQAKAPIYVMGRESVFGSLYAHVRWVQPVSGALHYLPIRRGPETPFAEQLQWDGFRRRRDAQMSGFGPYEQVRLARDTGGMFFMLPNEEADINGLDNRKLESLNNRVYLPSLDARREYEQERDRSPFRKSIWEVIVMLNPYDERFKQMEIPDEEYFSVNWNESSAAVMKRLQQIGNMIVALNAAQEHLEKVRPLRAKEASQRWRANFDLIYAQIFAYKVRLYEYGLALHQYGKSMPQRIKDKKSNRWSIRTYANGLIYPDAEQSKILKITKQDVDDANEKALKLLKEVSEQHAGTAWARRAEYELSRPFGASFNEHFFGPPGPAPNPPPPPPPPPPKL